MAWARRRIATHDPGPGTEACARLACVARLGPGHPRHHATLESIVSRLASPRGGHVPLSRRRAPTRTARAVALAFVAFVALAGPGAATAHPRGPAVALDVRLT